MALVRILVDGDGLLHQWKDLGGDGPHHEVVVRDELINRLTQYHDATGMPITIIFDAARAPGNLNDLLAARDVNIRYSRAGQTTQQLIERLAERFYAPDEVWVVTDDPVESKPSNGRCVQAVSCHDFVQMIEDTLEDLEREITSYNQKERSLFLRHS